MENKELINLVNVKVVSRIDEEYKQIDILTIIGIVAALVSLFKECKKLRENLEQDSTKILKVINRPNALNKIRLYLAVKKQCKKVGTQKQLNAIVKALLEAGRTATKEDVQMIYNATV